MISIFKSYSSIEADLIKAQLEAEDIPCFLKADNAGGTMPHLTFSNGIDIMVLEEVQKAAEKILCDL